MGGNRLSGSYEQKTCPSNPGIAEPRTDDRHRFSFVHLTTISQLVNGEPDSKAPPGRARNPSLERFEHDARCAWQCAVPCILHRHDARRFSAERCQFAAWFSRSEDSAKTAAGGTGNGTGARVSRSARMSAHPAERTNLDLEVTGWLTIFAPSGNAGSSVSLSDLAGRVSKSNGAILPGCSDPNCPSLANR
jgi:hypothetical protein